MQGFDDLLRAKIRVSGRSLASLVHETGIPKSTINNWQHGVVASPRDWRGILRLAAALHLDRADTDRLLVAADHSPLAELRAAHTSDEESCFAPWSAELRRTTPLQAPRGCAVFVNRESELASLAAHLETGGTTVVIEGMTGAGKSELAIRMATRLRNHYPDGIAWDELGATTLEATIAALAHGFGIPLDPKTSTPSRAATLRSALAGLRCLLVFDGVEDTLAVEALLPPKGSRYSVILTTQVATTATRLGAARITLEGFDASESASIDLYQEVLGGHRVSAQQPVFEQIAADCGYLPLALAITAWQLEAGLLQPEDLRTLLGSRRKIDSLTFGPVAIRTVLTLATGHLSEDARALLQVISIFPGHDTDADAIAAVARIEPYRARQIAAELQARSLLLFGRQPSRYRLHTLVRDFVSDGFDATELQARLIHTIVVSAEQHRYDSYWFADEESHFEGVLQLAKLLDATEWRVRGVLAMTPYWVQSGQLPRARTHLADVLEPARSLDAPELCARVHRWLAHVEDKLGNLDHAIALASEGLATLEGRDHPDTVCALKVTLAGIWISQNKLDEGGRLLSEALASAREHGFSNRICDALLNLGFIAREQGQLEAARGYYAEGIERATALGDLDRLGGFTNNLGVLESDLGNYAEADRLYAASADLCRRRGDTEGLCLASINLGNVALYQGNLQRAETQYWAALELARRARLTEALVTAYTNVAVAAANLGKLAKAEWYLLKAHVLARRDQRHERLQMVLETLGGVAFAAGRLEQALGYYESERANAAGADQRQLEASALARLGEVHTQMGSWDDATTALDRAASLMQASQNARGITEVQHHRAQLLHLLGQNDSARATIEATLGLARELGHQERLCLVLSTAASCLLADEDVDEARQAATESLAIARAITHPFCIADCLLSLAEVELTLGNASAAEAAFQEAMRVGADVGYRVAEAQGRFGLARTRATRDPQNPAAHADAIAALAHFDAMRHYAAADVRAFLRIHGWDAV